MELDLQEIRNKIDDIDSQMILLFSRRMRLVSEVAAYKKEKGLPILDQGREDAILERLAHMAGEEMANGRGWNELREGSGQKGRQQVENGRQLGAFYGKVAGAARKIYARCD